MVIIFDLDQTIVDSSIAEKYRSTRSWDKVYELIPNMSLYDGIYELISNLQKNGIKVAIVTSSPKPYCTKVLKHFNIKDVETVCYHDTYMHKPHPEPIIKLLELMKVNSEDAFSIGDDDKDITASLSANVRCGLALWGRNGKKVLNQNVPLFEKVSDFEQYLKSIIKF